MEKVFTENIIVRLSPDQKEKGYYIMMKKHRKLSVELRNYLQAIIEKYERENWEIKTKTSIQTKLI